MNDNTRVRCMEFATNEGSPPRLGDEDLQREQRALRDLIDKFGDQSPTNDDHGFYRKAGRYIARPMMKPRWPGDTGY